MKISITWLKEYVKFGLPYEKLAGLLTIAGLSVDTIESTNGDTCFTIDVPSNRPDCLSMIGIAREVAILTSTGIKLPKINYSEKGKDISQFLSVEVPAKELCPRYTARIVSGIKVGDSPEWLQNRLKSCGIRPVNNIVDITNYVLVECGQPLHAFDLKFLHGNKIIVRRAKDKEEITAIDGKIYTLSNEDLVIAGSDRTVAIAGVMGGKDSEINNLTKDVVIESAFFAPASIRRTSRKLGLSSESSYRFERGVNFETVDWASRRAAELMAQIAGGIVSKGVIDVASMKPKVIKTFVRPNRLERILGIEVPRSKITSILKSAGFEITSNKNTRIDVRVPSTRSDIKAEIDVIEEIARIYGYDKIPSNADLGLNLVKGVDFELTDENIAKLKNRVTPDLAMSKFKSTEVIVKSTLCGGVFLEVLTYSFIENKFAEDFSYWSGEPSIALKDPNGKIDKLMRKSLLPSLVNVIRTNEGYKEEVGRIFEITKVYYRISGKPCEKWCLGLATSEGLLSLKGILDVLLSKMGVEEKSQVSFEPNQYPFFKEQKSIAIRIKDKEIGYLGELLDEIRDKYEIRQNLALCELDFEALAECAIFEKRYKQIPRFPPVQRDIAIVVDERITWNNIKKCIRDIAPPFLEDISFFDIYKGKNIPDGKKSIAFSLTFRLENRTLTSEEVDKAQENIIISLEKGLGAKLRQ